MVPDGLHGSLASEDSLGVRHRLRVGPVGVRADRRRLARVLRLGEGILDDRPGRGPHRSPGGPGRGLRPRGHGLGRPRVLSRRGVCVRGSNRASRPRGRSAPRGRPRRGAAVEGGRAGRRVPRGGFRGLPREGGVRGSRRNPSRERASPPRGGDRWRVRRAALGLARADRGVRRRLRLPVRRGRDVARRGGWACWSSAASRCRPTCG